MNKLLLVISATFLFNSATALAAVETFNFTFSVESYSNTARATGFISFDTTNYYNWIILMMLYPKKILLILVCQLVEQIRNPENISI